MKYKPSAGEFQKSNWSIRGDWWESMRGGGKWVFFFFLSVKVELEIVFYSSMIAFSCLGKENERRENSLTSIHPSPPIPHLLSRDITLRSPSLLCRLSEAYGDAWSRSQDPENFYFSKNFDILVFLWRHLLFIFTFEKKKKTKEKLYNSVQLVSIN